MTLPFLTYGKQSQHIKENERIEDYTKSFMVNLKESTTLSVHIAQITLPPHYPNLSAGKLGNIVFLCA